MKYPRKWEEINNDDTAGAARLKVFGGWIVCAWSNIETSESICFVPDKIHEWELE